MTNLLDIVCFGEALVDFFPERKGIMLREAERFSRHLGGAPANVAVGLARLGLRVGLTTLVGADEFGAFLRDALAREGIDTTSVGTHPTARTGITFVAVGPKGERAFTYYRHPSADQMVSESDVDARLIQGARVFHHGSSSLAREPSRSATLAAIRAAREAGCIVSCDPNLRPHLWSDPAESIPLAREVLRSAEVVKISDDELGALVGTKDVEAGARTLRGWGVGLAVITLGERGCFFDGASSGTGHIPAVDVEVVDTTGAGDGFVAGLLAELVPHFCSGARPASLGRAVVESSCAFANRVAARVVTRFGATPGLPRRGEV
ncbi:MAG: carbohydrate kinase [Deltaproteobacteria bacterium]|nr:carbohydrate kinase [Deltaproteobacteria bacterium]